MASGMKFDGAGTVKERSFFQFSRGIQEEIGNHQIFTLNPRKIRLNLN